jgi:hypothetical protein
MTLSLEAKTEYLSVLLVFSWCHYYIHNSSESKPNFLLFSIKHIFINNRIFVENSHCGKISVNFYRHAENGVDQEYVYNINRSFMKKKQVVLSSIYSKYCVVCQPRVIGKQDSLWS